MDEKDCMLHKKEMEKKLKRIWNGLCGYCKPVAKYICGTKGVPSDKRIEKFTDELISRMRSHYDMDGASERFVRLYLYLAARACYYENEGLRTFGDIPDILRNMMETDLYDSPEKLALNGSLDRCWDEEKGINVWRPGLPCGFFEILVRSCEILSGRSIGDELTEELQKLLDRSEARETADRKAACEKYCEMYREKLADQTPKSLFPWFASGSDDRTACKPTDDRNTRHDFKQDAFEHVYFVKEAFRGMCILGPKGEPTEELKKRWEEWKHSLPDPERFLEACREFLELFFLVDLPFIVSALEEAVFLFLCRDEKAELGSDETFLKAYERLDMVCRNWDVLADGK